MTNASKVKQRRPSKAEIRAADRRRRRGRELLALTIGPVVLGAIVLIGIAQIGGSNARSGDRSGGVGPSRTSEIQVAGSPRSEPIRPGDRIPEFSGPALFGGGRVGWSDAAGSKAVLSIWAPWCPHCQAELPVLSRVLASYPDVKLVTITTMIGAEPGPTPDGYMHAHGLTFPVAVDDGRGTLMRALGVQYFPTIYFVNSDGTVSREIEGEAAESELRALIEALR